MLRAFSNRYKMQAVVSEVDPCPPLWLAAGHSVVTWTSVVGLESRAGNLRKVSGTNAWGNDGAISTQELSASGYPQGVTFKRAAGGNIMVGLGNTNDGASYTDIEFAMELNTNGHGLAVYESGAHVDNFGTYAGTDVLGVQVTGTTVEYTKNGVVFYTSTKTPTFPLHVDTAFRDVGGELSEIAIYAAPAPTCESVTWTDTVNVAASPGFLQKNAGSNDWTSAGAISTQALSPSAELQSVSFKCSRQSANDCPDTRLPNVCGTKMIAGLGDSNNGQHYSDMAFAMECDRGGDFSVYEAGQHKGVQGQWDPSDTFTIEVQGSAVRYLKNDVLFYTSSNTVAAFPLHLDTSIHNTGNALSAVTMCSVPAPGI
jgi:hypothetical protein